jgi:hypothetical protein
MAPLGLREPLHVLVDSLDKIGAAGVRIAGKRRDVDEFGAPTSCGHARRLLDWRVLARLGRLDRSPGTTCRRTFGTETKEQLHMNTSQLEELLTRDRVDLDVGDEREVSLDEENRELADARHVVEIRSFQDLQALELVPSGLDEQTVRDAILADDDEARPLAHAYLTQAERSCACNSETDSYVERPLKLTFRTSLRSAYIGIRKTYNPNLAKVMSNQAQAPYAFDDLQVAMVRGWVSRQWEKGVIVKPIWLLQNVTIGRSATLIIGRTENSAYLSCQDLRIHIGGKILIVGSGAKIKCVTAQGNIP